MKTLTSILLIIMITSIAWAEEQIIHHPNHLMCTITTCTSAETTSTEGSEPAVLAAEITPFFSNILDTSLWPARWYCGVWSPFHGWLYISSDIMIWAAYFLIPFILGYYLYKKRKAVTFPWVLVLFIAFILACGLTHLVDAAIFWWPAYKLSASIRLVTAIISWGTVFALVKVVPMAMELKSSKELQKLVDEQTKQLLDLNAQLQEEIKKKNLVQDDLIALNEELEEKVDERAADVMVANEQLRKINDLFKSIQAAAHIGVWEFDTESNELFWSDEVYRIHDLEPGATVDIKNAINYYHPDSRNTIKKAFASAIEENKPYDLELILTTAEDRNIWVRAIGIPMPEENKLQGMFLDVNETKVAQLKNAENRENLTAIVENTDNLIWSMDGNCQLLVFNNAFMETIKADIGITPKIGDSVFFDEYTEKALNYWKGKYHNVLSTGSKHEWTEEIKVNEEVKFLAISLCPIINKDGGITGISGIARDVTELKQKEISLKQSQEKILVLNDELEEKVAIRTKELNDVNNQLKSTIDELSAFSYSVSHDLRSPLRSIHGFTMAIKEDYTDKLDELGIDYLTRVLDSTLRMEQLIDDLLNLSRISRLELVHSKIDLTALVKEVIDGCSVNQASFCIQKNVSCNGDLQLMKIVMENLINNAIKYSSKVSDPSIEFGSLKSDDGEVYFIRDNGAGFNMEYKDKLFGAFQRLHATHEFPGTGIGLATVKRIIHKHGGKIWAEGEVNKGATFYFSI